MITSTIENYIKQIYMKQQELPNALLPVGKLAVAMGVVPGTATAMVKTLADAGLVDYEPRSGVRLTRGGEQLALHVLRRHRILESFLVKILGLDWSEVHEEAEALEHALSDKVLERMDGLLNHPQFDPHGDPIPTASGSVAKPNVVPLNACAEGSFLRVARVSDQDAAFLQYIEQRGLVPGTQCTLELIDQQADAITLRLATGETITLGGAAAAKIMVSPSESLDRVL